MLSDRNKREVSTILPDSALSSIMNSTLGDSNIVGCFPFA